MITRDYGRVEHKGKTLTLMQDAYCDNYGTDGGVRYYASARDAAGNIYRIAWDTTAEWDDMDPEDQDDESNACAWDNPASVELIEEVEGEG